MGTLWKSCSAARCTAIRLGSLLVVVATLGVVGTTGGALARDNTVPPPTETGLLVCGRVVVQFDNYQGDNSRYISGLKVTIEDAEARTYTATTDRKGFFYVANARPGRYSLKKVSKTKGWSLEPGFSMSRSGGSSKLLDLGVWEFTVGSTGGVSAKT